MRRHKKKSNPFKVIVILLVVLVIADAGFRFLLPSRQPEFNINRPVEYQALFVPNHYGRMLPNLDTKVEQNGVTFHVKTNSQGMRSPEFKPEKTEGVTRIAIVGDSASFGWLMEEEEAYPAILREKLQHDPSQKYELLNFSAPGLSSIHGWYLFNWWIGDVKPDVIVWSFGLYDSKLAGVSDFAYTGNLRRSGLDKPPAQWQQTLSSISTLSYWWFTSSLAAKLDNIAETIREKESQTSPENWNARVFPQDAYEMLPIRNEDDLKKDSRHILLDANIHNYHLYPVWQRFHNERNIPFVSIHPLISTVENVETRKLRYEKQLAYPGKIKHDDENLSLHFRVYAPNQNKMSVRLKKVNEKQDPSSPPDDVLWNMGGGEWYALNDSGINGDETTDDKVWSVTIHKDTADAIFYKYDHDHPPGEERNPLQADQTIYLPLSQEENVWMLNENHLETGFATTLPLVIYGHRSYQEFRMPANHEYPSKELHQSIANRLYFVITNN